MSKTTYGWQLDDEDDENDDASSMPRFMKRKPYQQFETTFTAQQLHFYISEDIGEPREYTEMIHKITYAAPSDVVYIHLNTNGGHLETGVQLINAMQNSQAKIVTILESVAYSLGTLIFLAGDQMVVNDNCMMMFHNFRGGVIGKGNELTSQLDATVKWFSLFAKKIYVPFLTEDEFARLLRGEDIWMHSADIRKRLDRMVKQSQEESNAKPPRKKKIPPTEVIEEPTPAAAQVEKT
jgi:ATP-dependent protease ClpP protease subunit